MGELDNKSIKELWNDILKLLYKDFEDYSKYLNPPATMDEIKNLEQWRDYTVKKEWNYA